MAPLYNTVPLRTFSSVLDQKGNRRVSSIRIAFDTLDYIEAALDSRAHTSDLRPTKKDVTWVRSARRSLAPILRAGGLITALFLSIYMYVRSQHASSRCEHTYYKCIDLRSTEPSPQDFGDAGCHLLLDIVEGMNDLSLACRLQYANEIFGMHVWRWLLFCGLAWPINIMAHTFMALLAVLAQYEAFGHNGFYYLYGLHRPLAHLIRNCIWFATWFAFSAAPLKWAEQSERWSQLANAPVWTAQFQEVHAVVWRCLLIYTLLTLVGAISACCGKLISVHFHQPSHFSRMQEALVHRNVIKKLLLPLRIHEYTNVWVHNKQITLSNNDGVHWCTLRFLTQLTHPSRMALDAIVSRKPMEREKLFLRASAVQDRVANVLARKYVKQFAPSSKRESRDAGSVTRSQQSHSQQVTHLAAGFIEAAQKATNKVACFQTGWNQLTDTVAASALSTTSACSSVNQIHLDGPNTTGLDAAPDPVRFASEQGVLRKWYTTLTVVGSILRDQLATNTSSCNSLPCMQDCRQTHAYAQTINTMFDHLAGSETTVDDVFGDQTGGDSSAQEHHAMQIAYFIFWNLRASKTTGLVLPKQDVVRSAGIVGIQNVDDAWRLLDLNSDNFVTLGEIVASVTEVLDNRKYLLQSLRDGKSVVQQFRRVIYTALLLVLLLIGVSLFRPGALASVWTGASAVVITVSFVFANAVRQLFENCIFLFIRHPFDVGDTIKLYGEKYVICSMSLYHVQVTHVSGVSTNIPLHTLHECHVVNKSRSHTLWDNVEFATDITVTLAQCERVADYVVDVIKRHGDVFGGLYRVVLAPACQDQKMKLIVYYQHKLSGVDGLQLCKAQTFMSEAVCRGIRSAQVTYTLPHALDPDMFSVLARDA